MGKQDLCRRVLQTYARGWIVWRHAKPRLAKATPHLQRILDAISNDPVALRAQEAQRQVMCSSLNVVHEWVAQCVDAKIGGNRAPEHPTTCKLKRPIGLWHAIAPLQSPDIRWVKHFFELIITACGEPSARSRAPLISYIQGQASVSQYVHLLARKSTYLARLNQLRSLGLAYAFFLPAAPGILALRPTLHHTLGLRTHQAPIHIVYALAAVILCGHVGIAAQKAGNWQQQQAGS